MEFLQPANWPRPKGYANGVAAKGKLIFVSGMIGWDAGRRVPCAGSRGPGAAGAREHRRRCSRRRAPVREHIVRMTWYVVDKREYVAAYPRIGVAYREIIGRHFPAMTAVEVAALIEDAAKVEIEVTAVIPD